MMTMARGIQLALRSLSFNDYLGDENVRMATERRIEIIGEAARRVSDEFKQSHPEIPWRSIINQRNFLIHGYDEIDHGRVWRVANQDVPQLVGLLEPIVSKLEMGD